MALITRISRLFTADMHAVLDRMEEPEILLKQAIRDMQASVATTERQIRALRARGEQIESTTQSSRARLQELDEELTVCLDAGNDDLARSVIQRKLRLERHLEDLGVQSARARKMLEEHERTLSRRQDELETLRSKSAVFEAGEQDSVEPMPAGVVTPEEVEVALLKEKQRRART